MHMMTCQVLVLGQNTRGVTDEAVLATFAEKGLLPPKEVAHWRTPVGEAFPRP